ncbi:hypothetical protein OIU77_023153 [Salix suchowensis]|uniref:Uncharacterized protein n=1 Tax=Salix suchowensis TaxID=1278906 RepID=A0ABQ9C2U8_9ROSI|nr:hypothetical protein OIU77_023153 [Salix suchowensis]
MKTTLVSTGATKEKYPELHVLTLDQTHQNVPVSGCPRKLGQAQLAEALNEPQQGTVPANERAFSKWTLATDAISYTALHKLSRESKRISNRPPSSSSIPCLAATSVGM